MRAHDGPASTGGNGAGEERRPHDRGQSSHRLAIVLRE
jgi:hypothetical protein